MPVLANKDEVVRRKRLAVAYAQWGGDYSAGFMRALPNHERIGVCAAD
jgi:hypothetical protein